MNQTTLTKAIAQRFFLTQAESGELLDFFLARITSALQKDERVTFHDFGSFTKEIRAAKRLRHPKTRKLLTLPRRPDVRFKPSKNLLEKLG